MRKLVKVALVAGAVALFATVMAVGWTAPAEAAPASVDAPAHSVSTQQIINICAYGRPQDYYRWSYRHLHYGQADVVQCAYAPSFGSPSLVTVACWQYVWNAPGSWNAYYEPTTTSVPYCW